MSEIIIPKRRMERRNTAAALAALNEVLLAGEWCLETDTRKVKFGDGVTAYNSLLYVGELANLADPNADRLVFWDDSAGAFAFLTLGTNLSITGTTINAAGGGAAGVGAQIGYAMFETDTAASGTTLIPFDNTIPQITEGNASGLTLAYTPQFATSLLEIEATIPYANHSVSGITLAFTLFDGGSNAIWSGLANSIGTAGAIQQPPAIRRVIVAGSTSPRTYTVRFGAGAAGTSYVNAGNAGASFFGTSDVMTLTVKEIKQ